MNPQANSENLKVYEQTSPAPEFTIEKYLELRQKLMNLQSSLPGSIPVVAENYELGLHNTFNLNILNYLRGISNPIPGEAEMLTTNEAIASELQSTLSDCSPIVLDITKSLDLTNSNTLSSQVITFCEKFIKESDNATRSHQALVIQQKLKALKTAIGKSYFLFNLAAQAKDIDLIAFVLIWMLIEDEQIKQAGARTLALAETKLKALKDSYPFIMLLEDIVITDKFYAVESGNEVTVSAFVRVESGQRRVPICKVSSDVYASDATVEKAADELTQTIVHESLHLALEIVDDEMIVTEMLTQYETMRILYQSDEKNKDFNFSSYIWKSNGYARIATLVDCLASAATGIDPSKISEYALRQDSQGFTEFINSSLAELSDYSLLADELERRVIIGPQQYERLKQQERITLQDLIDALNEFAASVGPAMAEIPGLLLGSYSKDYQQATGETITMRELIDNKEKRVRFLNFIIETRANTSSA